MSDVIDAEGFRENVGILLVREGGEVFLGRRAKGRGWQFPQGGVRAGEALEQALYRELEEEIGLTAADVTLLGQTSGWLHYRLPPRLVRRDRSPLCIGQKQRWFLLRLARPEARFVFDGTDEPEFDEWRWAQYWDPIREVVYFKRPVYRRVLHELGALVFPRGLPPYPAWWDATADLTPPPDPA